MASIALHPATRPSWTKVLPQLRALTPRRLRDDYFPLPENKPGPEHSHRLGGELDVLAMRQAERDREGGVS